MLPQFSWLDWLHSRPHSITHTLHYAGLPPQFPLHHSLSLCLLFGLFSFNQARRLLCKHSADNKEKARSIARSRLELDVQCEDSINTHTQAHNLENFRAPFARAKKPTTTNRREKKPETPNIISVSAFAKEIRSKHWQSALQAVVGDRFAPRKEPTVPCD